MGRDVFSDVFTTSHPPPPHPDQSCFRLLRSLGTGQAGSGLPQGKGHVSAGGEPGKQAALLEHDGPTGRRTGYRLAADGDGSLLGQGETGDEPQQGGLAAAGGAHHGQEGAVLHLQGHPVQHTGAAGVGEGHVAQGDFRHGKASFGGNYRLLASYSSSIS